MARRTSARTLQAKVVLVGHQSVGKTSLLTRYVSGDFDVNVRETIGASFFPKEMDVDGKLVGAHTPVLRQLITNAGA
eukprot:m.214600 g.214600  ORF g.214600 m.214600 type:complete len:77 (+) comp15530_c0_seq15:1854-2084(+)